MLCGLRPGRENDKRGFESLQLLRRVIFWCHLVAGVCAGVVILIMSVTGVLLAYERQVTRWADTRGYVVARPGTDAPRLPLETLLAKVREGQTAARCSSTRVSRWPCAACSPGCRGGAHSPPCASSPVSPSEPTGRKVL